MSDSDVAPRPSGRLRFAEDRRLDLAGYASLFGAKLLTTAYRRMLCLVYPLQGRRIPVYRAQIEVDFRVLESSDLDAYSRLRPRTPRENIKSRLDRGHSCITSWHEGEIVDAGWTGTGEVFVPYLQRFVCLGAGDIYSYDAYTHPRYRGYGLYMARNSFTARRNQNEGFERSVALVAPENYTAWVILTRSGLETIGQYSYLRTPVRGVYWQRAVPGRTLPQLRRISSNGEGSSAQRLSGAAA